MTTVYFVRHAQAEGAARDAASRPLTEKGRRDCALVTAFLRDKQIDVAFSSPYKRAIDTIAPFAREAGLAIDIVPDFREHYTKSDSYVNADYLPFIQQYWQDKTYKVDEDESFFALQSRNIAALQAVVAGHPNQTILIGTHGMALSAILHYYDSAYDYDDFLSMMQKKPWIVKMTFENGAHMDTTCIDLPAAYETLPDARRRVK